MGTHEAGDFGLQILVDLLGAADKAHRRQTEAPAVIAAFGGLNQLGAGGQAQVDVPLARHPLAQLQAGDPLPQGGHITHVFVADGHGGLICSTAQGSQL